MKLATLMNENSDEEVRTLTVKQPSIVGMVTNNFLTKSTGAFRRRKQTIAATVRKSRRKSGRKLKQEDPLE